VLRLYELDVTTGRERELVTPAQLLGSAEETLSVEERARRERARITTRGFTTFDLSKDGQRLLITLSGKLHVLDRANLRSIELPGERWIDPRFSPDANFVAGVSGNELYVIDLKTATATPLTSGASETLHHGLAEFVAQEEMSRREGYWWSPDSQYLLYQQNDESDVEARYIADPLQPSTQPQRYFYPRAGTANTKVRLGVIARVGGPTRWISWDADTYPYLARVKWSERAPPMLLVQNRAQQKQLLLAVDTATGETRTLLEETDAAWLNLDASDTPLWLKDGSHFLWTTERSGSWQVELRDANGRFVRFLTPPDFGYGALVGLDEPRDAIFALGSTDSLESHLWRFPLGGSGVGEMLTRDRGVYTAVLADDGSAYALGHNTLDGRRGVSVIVEGRPSIELPTVAETPASLPTTEVTRTTSTPGFDAAITRPREFDASRKYPVILYAYAGPTAKFVRAVARGYFIDQWWADQGYIVVRLDGRGTPNRGRDWERAIRGNLIDVALEDQVSGLRALAAEYLELDLSRVGVIGWSFGGYFAAMAVTRRPDVFKAAVAGAPVVTWENYDTHYTERYLGLPQDNPDGYRRSDVTTFADQLSRPLLLIHGLTDDNVYAQHTFQLIDALFMAGKPYEFMPMLGTHLIADPDVRRNQMQRVMEFFGRTLLEPKTP
jgi:dipeptidyl-peptidase-4